MECRFADRTEVFLHAEIADSGKQGLCRRAGKLWFPIYAAGCSEMRGVAMRLQNNINVFAGDTRNQAQQAERNRQADRAQENGKNKTFYAGNFLVEFPLKDRIAQRKTQAQERAMKIIGDAWDADRVLDNEINDRQERIRELRVDNADALESLKEFRQMEDELREGFGVAPDSEEQMDLELLKRYVPGYKPTEEEKERLDKIRENGLTEYQSRALELDKAASYYRKLIASNNESVYDESKIVEGIRAERVKFHGMLDAQGQAEDVLAASRDEVIGMVADEAKEHLDEEQEKREEQAEAIEEKREEQEEILEEREERQEELEDLIKDMPVEETMDMNQTIEDVKQQVQKVLNEAKLLEEDIKGAKVDLNV